MEYGLLGAKLGHSCSPRLHTLLAGYDYQLIPKPTEQEAQKFLLAKEYRGVNVTIPYKRLACQLCDQLDEGSRITGTVNTVVNRNGTLYGYNTDILGFLRMAQLADVCFEGRTVLILGTGGTSHTVQAAVKAKGAARVFVASRHPAHGELPYFQAEKQTGTQILINTTPVGMYPDNGSCPIDPALFPRLEAVLDVVYNPLRTCFVQKALAMGVKAQGGLSMLVAQAQAAAELFLDQPIPAQRAAAVYRQLVMENSNISLIGMPSCGKSTIGRRLAKMLGRPFVDVDREIEEAEHCTVSQYFEQQGEIGFRRCEAAHTARLAARGGQIIACGGGVVETPGNVPVLKQNGVILFLDRPVEGLKVGGHRPLSKSPQALRQMEQRRRPLYEQAADIRIENSGEDFATAARAAEEAIYAYFGVERPQSESSGGSGAGPLRDRGL